MGTSIEYRVVRLRGPESELSAQLSAEGAFGWSLVQMTFEPREAGGTGAWLCVFRREKEAAAD
ncbi:MAG TPA: hypothetical protein VG797_01060 [Phycisphaerales bacterium]|nr:hypothetical protein [Phycisphaerales bacterium]